MEIRFTRHALEKFAVLARHGVRIARKKVEATIRHPERRDYSRTPLTIAQAPLGRTHVLRVVYKIDEHRVRIITFYPGRKTQYEKKTN